MSDPTKVDIELGGRTVHAANLYPPKRPGWSFDGAAGLPGPMRDGAPDRWGRLPALIKAV